MSKPAFVLLSILALFGLLGCPGRSAVFEIPDGFTGWVNVNYGAAHCESAKRTWTTTVIQIDQQGLGCASDSKGEGLRLQRYYYLNEAGERLKELESSEWGGGGEIWAGGPRPDEHYYHFFVGSEEAFKNAGVGPRQALREASERP